MYRCKTLFDSFLKYLGVRMRILLIFTSVLLIPFCAAAQNAQIGLQAGVHSTLVQIKYFEVSEWEPLAYHLNLVAGLPLRARFSLQTELGFGERRTIYANYGVSHSDYRDYRLLQVESAVLGKYQLSAGSVRMYGLGGIAGGIALAGTERRRGSSVGPSAWDATGRLDFEYFPYRRWSWGPVLGLNAQYHLGVGDFVLYCRAHRTWERLYPGIDSNLSETRFIAGFGFYRNI
jgi:hypothetical protein